MLISVFFPLNFFFVAVMISCWDNTPRNRPDSFDDIVYELEILVRHAKGTPLTLDDVQ